MPAEYIAEGRALAGNSQDFEARLTAKLGTGATVTNEGKAILAADVSSITCTIYDVTAGTSSSITISSASDVIAALAAWTRPVLNDTVGRNFAHHVAGSYFPTAKHVYVASYVVVLTSGAGADTIKWKYKITTYSVTS